MKNYLQLKFESIKNSLNFKLIRLSKLFKEFEYDNQNKLELSSELFVQKKKANYNIVYFCTLMFSLFGFIQNVSSQTTLAPGDVALLGINASSTDQFYWTITRPITAGTVIYFTDNGYTSTTAGRTGEGFISFTASSNYPAGTVFTWTNGATVSSEYATLVGGTANNPSNFSFNASGDQFFIYQSSTALTAGTITTGNAVTTWAANNQPGLTILYGINYGVALITTGTGAAGTTYQPSTSLLASANFVNFPSTSANNLYYTTNGSAATAVSLFNSASGFYSELTNTARFVTSSSALTFPLRSIFAIGSLTAVNTTSGSASPTPTSFQVTARGLTNNIALASLSPFEYSTTLGGTYSNTLTLTQSSGSVNTTVFVRLAATATVVGSPYSGNIGVSSSGAQSFNVATVSSTVTAAVSPTVNLSVSSNTGSEAGTTAITVTATASSSVTGNQTVALVVTGTGITAGDYTLSNTTITILSGQTSGSVTFTIVDDILVESTETATLTISSPSSGITLGSTTFQNITITDNDVAPNPTVSLSVSSNTGSETGTTAITVTATASSAVSGNQTVALAVTGTNVTASDFTLSNATITILSGQTTGSVTFTVVDDALVETTETATLTISSPSSGITLGTPTTQNIAITDNDVAPNPTVTLSVDNNIGYESSSSVITVTATATSAVIGNQTVNLGVSGTNITGSDYSLSTAVITILNGQTIGSVTFTVLNDVLSEGTETATLTISSPSSGITLGTQSSQVLTIIDNDAPLTIDLSTYVRVGRYDLPEPTRTTPPTNSLLAQEASGVTYNWDTNTLFVIGDGSTSVVQVTKSGQYIDSMTLALGSSPQGTEFYDTEGITYIGGGQFVLSEERDRQLVKFTYVAGSTLVRSNTQTVKIGTFVNNIGTEGMSYDPITGGYIVAKEISPIGIFQTNVNFAAGTATNGSPTTVNSTNLFDPALLGVTDIADVFALSNIPALNSLVLSNNILVLSQESAKVVNVNRSGVISNSLTIVSDAGNPLNVASQQHEGLTMDNDGILYVISENGGGDIDHPQLWVYAPSTVPNQAPTAIALANTTTSILENTSTSTPIKVADIVVTDDGFGTNSFTLTGADASSFEITGASLYIKVGVVLDFETKTTYNVTVNVDDTTIGTTPDASVNFVLNVIDVVVETPSVATITISEVAPWGSGNSPAAADWFEVTNNGTTAVNISGWKVDDNSNSFAAALALTGITSIAPGESVIFLESSATNPAATVTANFKSLWFGSNPPATLQVGTYQGSGIGLSTGGDAVNLYDASGVLQANIVFGVSSSAPYKTFNNAQGLNNATISLLSQVGVNDAFIATNDVNEIGSPGSIGRLFISEVAPWSSGNSPVAADWFEVTNTRALAVDITGWKIDDNSQSPAGAVLLNGITSINPGESVIFIESNNLTAITTTFLNNWFGTNPSSGLRIGNYTGTGVGLGTGGDQVNLYNASNVLQTSVLFGASPTGTYTTFDNAIGVNSLVTPITQFSAVGVNGAFIAANSSSEIGSPGTIITSPCPTISVTATPALATVCFGASTTVSVTATGGTLPYTISGNPLTVGAGTYTYTVTDAKGCTGTASTTVNSLPQPIINLSVSTNTASETAGTIVTVTANASVATCVDETVSINITGSVTNAIDYNLSNSIITIPAGFTSGSVTFTVLNDNIVEPSEIATLTISNPSSGIILGSATVQNISIADFTFTLQVLHASDFEAAVDAVQDAPRFAAIVDVLEESYTNTIKLSSGDNYIPGPFLSSGEDSTLSAAFKTAYESYYNTTFSTTAVNLLPSIGRADISIMNFIGIEASALGNHEFDLGTTEVRNIIRGANSSATVRSWFGAQFPYLSANLNFSGDGNLSAIATTNRLLSNTAFQSNPTEAVTAITNKLKLAPSTIIMKGGQKIGVVGATTQVLASISSPGATTVVGGNANDMDILAGILQPVVNSLIADGCNKIILLSHLQQISFEKELAGKLTGVDIIMSGGSNTLMADANDRLRTGDVATETYPFLTTDLSGNPLALINTDGNFKYVGRLVVDFDSNGTLIPSSIDSLISGVYAADQQGLNDAWGSNVANAFAVGTRGYQVQLLCNAIGNVIAVKDGNLFGKTSVFLEGRRNFVRTEETNLGNVSAEANLWLAKFYDPTTVISIKNGGGIRSAIGNVLAVGNDVTYAPPIANPLAGKQSGDISQLDIENSLRFNNQLSLITVTASGLRSILEHAVTATTATATPGQFAQVAGVRYSYNFSLSAGARILNAVITDASGNIIDTLVINGVTVGNLSRTFRVVTLNFLAGGGDGYPFSTLGTSRIDLNTIPEQGPAAASFTNSGSEQDAFAEYMKNQYSTVPYSFADTPITSDCRIQRVPARPDNVLPPSAGINGSLSICNGTIVTQNQLFAALGGTPATGGTWSPAFSGAGVYTYTVTSPSCAGSASSTVTVTETNLIASSNPGTITCPGGTTTVTVLATGGTAPYTGTGTFTVTAGAYSYTVTDANGCTAVTSGVVNAIADTTSPTIYFQPSGFLPGVIAPSTTQSPYLQSQSAGGKFTSILSVNDAIGGYRMVGIPDGLGAYDNNNGTFTLLMNHEIGNTQGITRAHGSIGSFVSKWVINKSNLSVVSGSDLIQTVYLWNTGTNSFVQGTSQFNRFCSADLAPTAAFYNQATGLGTQERIFLNGEESGPEGRAFGHILTGASAGVSYQLPYLGRFSWENVLASTASGDKTVVAGTDDNAANGQVYFYIGTKNNSGTVIDRAGLNNGKLYGVKVPSLPNEVSASIPSPNTPFALEDLGFVQNTTGATLNTNSVTAGVTNFLRPEDGSFDPSNPNDFYFVTTNAFTAPSRLWRLRFNDIANPETGGTITAVLDGTEGQRMFDNITIDKFGHILLQEDPGGQAHNAKVWQYTIATDALKLIGKHDPARFGDVVGSTTTLATSPFNNDEESSGIIDVSDILGPGMFLLDVQAHYTTGLANLTEVVQGGQLMAFFNPESVGSSLVAAPAAITACSGTGVNLGTPITADNCSVASVTNNAPATFPIGTTTVTWTVTDASGNTATATQTVTVTNLVATATAGTISCFGGTTTVTVAATGGTAPYTGTGTFTVSAGAYSFTVTDANGCTSVVSGNLTQPEQLTTSTSVEVATPYTWPVSGLTYSASGIYTFNTVNGNGCTVINTLNLTINSAPSSVIIPATCGVTLATINSYVYANLVANAQAYRFEVTDTSTMQVQTIDKALRVFQLTQLTNYAFNRTYQLRVAVRTNNVWSLFGAPCSITTPATTTQLQSSQCGGTITTMGDVIYANNVPFATGYRFRVINLLTSNVQVLDRPLREFRMNLLVNPQYNTQYSVEVAVRNTDGTYLPYGTICTITTPVFPTTSLQSSQCDYTATSASETIYATSFSGATTYRFRFVNTGLGYTYTFDRPIRSFVLNTVPGLLPATTYSVQISVELNGEFGPYGKVCSLTTPVSVARAIEKGATASAFKATAYPNPYDNAFNLNVATSSDSIIEVRVYDMIGKLIETQKVEATAISTLQIGERYPSGVYNVIVSQGDQSQNVRVIKR